MMRSASRTFTQTTRLAFKRLRQVHRAGDLLAGILMVSFFLSACQPVTPDTQDIEATQQAAPTSTPVHDATQQVQVTGTAAARATRVAMIFGDLDVFKAVLTESIASLNYDVQSMLMTNPFLIAGWQSEGAEFSPRQAIEQFRTNFRMAPAVVFEELPPDALAEILGGADPRLMFGPDVKVASFLHSLGWGGSASGEAILIITELPDGTYAWRGVLLDPSGISQLAPTPAEVPPLNPENELDGFNAQLTQAISGLDSQQMQALMSDPFVLAGWESQGAELPAAQAVQAMFESEMLTPTSALTFETPTRQSLTTFLSLDPYILLGPDANIVRVLYSKGWGPQGEAEAMIFIGQNPDNGYEWRGILYAVNGF